jgi:hypothetical protein
MATDVLIGLYAILEIIFRGIMNCAAHSAIGGLKEKPLRGHPQYCCKGLRGDLA